MDSPTLHASCVSVGGRGVLIRGASGAGKSHLAFALILAGGSGRVPPTELVADDRVHVNALDGRLVATAPHALAGLIEIRGAGLRRLPHVAEVSLHLVVDLDAPDAARLPAPEACRCVISGIELARLPVLRAGDALQQVLACLLTDPAPG
ncbi:HPr kinase/phosphatase C-terminal domain-containing protein [Ancylobacter sp. WKF20]|uniref:HPr kinase/phosphorylase n=1 Tax=Ancylobacter sp. WKF20 TaxID=3039801 RepID=UPI0024342923|nr:HPr kinase/phosphatase C-terminal domain-containing protein [Ancylobacter sp. WKF20]WGD29891.1 HPr kinase/phosphatase C-terminal domain-containing protein [Ancylobacter sp. WKF20]